VDNIEQIYAQYFANVFHYVLSLCHNETIAEDITSETFIKAIKSIGSFRGDCSVKVWLCQIAKNTYFSLLKKRKGEALVDYAIEAASVDQELSQQLSDKASVLEIHRCLRMLDEPYKEVFTLRTFGELSFAEIAELFGKTENWARVTYHRSKIKLREALS